MENAETQKIPAQRKQVTVLIADIRGFSQLSSILEPEMTILLLNRFFSEMVDQVHRFHGTVDKFMGDAILAVFDGDHVDGPAQQQANIAAQNAVACAVSMQQSLNSLNHKNAVDKMPPLYIGIGIHSGEVIAGCIGSSSHNEKTVIGKTVNMAARVEAHSLRGQILLSEATYERTQGFVKVADPSRVFLKGVSQPVRLFELLKTQRPNPMIVPRREERKSPRVEVHMPLSFQCVAGPTVLREEYHGEILDLSYHGMKAFTPIKLEPYTDIKFPLSSSLFGEQLGEVYAKVLKSSTMSNTFGHTANMEFTAMRPQSQFALNRFVDGLIA
ncbi:adenylate/guanylate cyclase domain-containing protein [Pleionea sp. CnH1-48]|uniref:adenylate/guanylate cyclase domain-containing protein n=1 Tax=Pleionea sp. CnH1-48 TaxID=2954494 RepID=UPI00209830F5|nr:adenylate/guanylate cyclase domain-containing protein [Pleionea sp. CnH1-48]MCO7225838.1 PilZ domain-containing protein [Pleionea sp. CnH1-48]